MTARTHHPTHREAAAGRLPWWSLALPAAAFAALLALTLVGGGTHSADAARPLADLLARLAQALPG
jgi:hypothetical protein